MSNAERRSSAGGEATHGECSSDDGDGHGQRASSSTQCGEEALCSVKEHWQQVTDRLRRPGGEDSGAEEALEQHELRHLHGRRPWLSPPPEGPRGGDSSAILVDGDLDSVDSSLESRSSIKPSACFARPPRAAVRPLAPGGGGGAGRQRWDAAAAEREELQADDDYALAPQYGDAAVPGDDTTAGAVDVRSGKDAYGDAATGSDAGAWSCGRTSPTRSGGDARHEQQDKLDPRAADDQGKQGGAGTGLILDAVEREPKRRRLRGKQPTVGPMRHRWPNSLHDGSLDVGAAASGGISGDAWDSSSSSLGVSPSRFTTATCTWDRLAVERNRDGRGLDAWRGDVEAGWMTRGGRPPDVTG